MCVTQCAPPSNGGLDEVKNSSECLSLKLFKEGVLLCGLSKTCSRCYTYEWDVVEPMESPLKWVEK